MFNLFKRKNYKILYRNKLKELLVLKDNIKISDLKPVSGDLRKFQIDNILFLKEITDLFTSNNIEYFLDAGSLLGAYRNKMFTPWDDDVDIAMMRKHYQKMLDFCRNNFIEIDTNKLSLKWYNLDKIKAEYMHKFPNKIIFVHTVMDTVIFKGSSFNDMVSLDIFPSDYYAEDYTMEEHRNYLNNLKQKKSQFKNYNEIKKFIDNEIKNNKNIVEKSNKIYYGIDSFDSYNPIRKHNNWYYENDIYPIKQIEFEEFKFFANNNIEKKLKYMYGENFNQLPKRLEFAPTFKLIKSFAKNLKNIEKTYKHKNKKCNKTPQEVLKNVNVQKQINKLAQKLKNKRIIIYGAGNYAKYIMNNFDLSKLNIIAISDKKFSHTTKTNELYKTIAPSEIKNENFDEIFTLLQNDYNAKQELEDEILIFTKYINKDVKPLIKTELSTKNIKNKNSYYKKLYYKIKDTYENLLMII